MQIFLQILAVIGIILLCIIGFVLLVIGLILFVPIRYKLKASKESELVAQVRLTWLLHFLSVKYLYPEPGEIVVRILGAQVWKMKLKEDESAKDEETELKTEPKTESSKDQKSETEKEIKTEAATLKTEAVNPEPKKNEDETNSPETEKQNNFEKIQYKIKNICDKIKKILNDYEYYRDLLQEKENRLLFERCKKRIFKILKSIRPRVLQADILVGTGEPDTTGYILAVYGILVPLFGEYVNITPDFDNKVFEGRIYAKGRITIFNLLYNGLKIYFDDQLHLLLDNLKRKDV